MGEEFRIKGIRAEVLYKISEKGLVKHHLGSDNWETESLMLVRLLTGDFAEIIKLPWKPKYDEDYYIPSVGNALSYNHFYWKGDKLDNRYYNLGIVCKTKEEAVAMVKKMLAAVQEQAVE